MTPKQARFVDEYMVDLNATQAAIRAGYTTEGPSQAGLQIISNPEVAAAIADRQQERAESTQITQERVIRELVAIATEARDNEQYGPAVRAWELVGKHLGMWPQRPVEVNATITLEIQQRVMEWRRIGLGDALDMARQLAPGLLGDDDAE